MVNKESDSQDWWDSLPNHLLKVFIPPQRPQKLLNSLKLYLKSGQNNIDFAQNFCGTDKDWGLYGIREWNSTQVNPNVPRENTLECWATNKQLFWSNGKE